ncbi:MAG: hypothetical protein AAGH38_01750, partial [Pseudomonadota bacterium]
RCSLPRSGAACITVAFVTGSSRRDITPADRQRRVPLGRQDRKGPATLPFWNKVDICRRIRLTFSSV